VVSLLWWGLGSSEPRPASAGAATSTPEAAPRDDLVSLLTVGELEELDPEALLVQVVALRGSDERDLLRELLSSGPAAVRPRAASLVGLLRDEASQEGLEALGKSEDPLTRLIARLAVAEIQGLSSDALLVGALAESPRIAGFALERVRAGAGSEVLDAVLELARSGPEDLRAPAVRAALRVDSLALRRLLPEPSAPEARPGPTRPEVTRPLERPARPSPRPSPSPVAVAVAPKTAVTPAAQPARPSAEPKPAPAPKKPKGPSAAQRTSALLAKGDFEGARALATQRLRKDPKHAELHRLHARALLGLAKPDEAVAALQESMNLDPEKSRTYFDLGCAFLEQKKTKQGLAALGMALRLGFADLESLRGEPRLKPLRKRKDFLALMARFFHSPAAASPDASERLEVARKRLKRALKQKDDYRRALAIRDFPEAGSLEATQVLVPLLKDRALVIRRVAAEVLGEARDSASVDFLLALPFGKMSTSERIAWIWSLRGLKRGAAARPLVTALGDGKAPVRMAAAQAVGYHPHPDAVAPLIALLEKAKPRDAVVLVEALGRVTGEDLGYVAEDWRNWWSAQAAQVSPKIGPVRDPCAKSASGTLAPPAAFAERSGKAKSRALRQNGGSKTTESAVRAALKWLSEHQNEDGRWDTDQWALRCKNKEAWKRVTKVRKRQWDVQVTGLALLAFLGSDHTHTRGAYKRSVFKGLEFLRSSQRKDGYFKGDHTNNSWYSQAVATAAVCEAYLLTRDCNYRQVAQRAVDYVVRHQHENGGWGWAREESHTVATGWLFMALTTAHEAGLRLPVSALVRVRHFLDDMTLERVEGSRKPGFVYGNVKPATKVGEGLTVLDYTTVRGGGGLAPTSVAVWCRIFSGQATRHPLVAGGLGQVAKKPLSPDKKGALVLNESAFFGSQALLWQGGKTWRAYNEVFKKSLLGGCSKEGCERGSWTPATDRGRVYATAMGALLLETYYRLRYSK
jgi:HEAT repeat protein